MVQHPSDPHDSFPTVQCVMVLFSLQIHFVLHLQVAVCSHAFMKEIKTLLDPSAGNPTHPTVQKDIKGMLVEWEKSFAGDSQLAIVRNTLQELKRRGMDLADLGSSTEGISFMLLCWVV